MSATATSFNRYAKLMTGFTQVELDDVIFELERLREIQRAGQFTHKKFRFGHEVELGMVDRYGRPIKASVLLLDHVLQSQHELGFSSLECNPGPMDLDAGVLGLMAKYIDARIAEISRYAAQSGQDINPFAHGCIFGANASHMTGDWLAPKPRYTDLTNRVCASGPVKMRIKGPHSTWRDTRKTLLGEGYIHSWQPHLQVPPDELGDWYNMALVVAPALLGLSVNSPLAFEQVLHPETRLAIWEQVIQHGVFGPGQYLKEGTSEAIVQYHELGMAGGAWITLPGRLGDHGPWALPNLAMLNGFRWKHSTRLVYGFSPSDGPHGRLECRQLAMCPAEECSANFAAWIGLMAGARLKHERACAIATYEQAEEGFQNVAKTWDDPRFFWCGEKVPVKAWWLEEGLELVRSGLKETFNLHPAEIDRALDCLRFRAEHSTGAELVRRYWERVEGPVAKKVQETSRFVTSNLGPYRTWQ